MTFFWKFYWLGLVVFVEFHVYSEFFRHTANKWREADPVHAHLIPNFITWRVNNSSLRPTATLPMQPFIAPNLFESHKKLFGLRPGLFHRDGNERTYMVHQRRLPKTYSELHKFNLTEFTRAFALI